MEKLNENENSTAVEDTEKRDPLAISDTVMVYRDRPFTPHGNVFHGVIKSGVYGNRPCAIKYARQSEQNISEAEVLDMLRSHTHVISLIQAGTDQTSLFEEVFLALEACNKLNFRQYLTKRKTEVPDFDINWGFNYCKQIIAGMTHVHDNLIIHRDLKPSNILLSHDLSIAKIADFGSSKQVKASNSMIPFNKAFGTHGYRPPEGIGLPESFGSLKTDNYSLGLVFYFILSYGESPLGDDPTKWDVNVTDEVLDLSKLQVPNPKTMKHLLSLMLSKDRSRRPSIWQIPDHQCWSGKEENCDFDYGFEEEFLDSSENETETSSMSSEDSAEELDNRRKACDEIVKICHLPTHRTKYSQRDEWLHQSGDYPKLSEQLQHFLQLHDRELTLKGGREEGHIQLAKDSVSKSVSRSYSNAIKTAEHLNKNGHHNRAMIFLKTSYDSSVNEDMQPDSKLINITFYIIGIQNATELIIAENNSSRHIAETHGYYYMKNLLNDLREVKSDDKYLKARVEANCIAGITFIAGILNKYRESRDFCISGVSILESHFGSNATKYQHYGVLLNNLGAAYFGLKQYLKAENCYLKAIDAYQKSLDFGNEVDRQQAIKNTEENLACVLEQLHKK